MLATENFIEKNTVATLELADFPLQKGSVGLLVQKWESAAASRAGPLLPHSPASRAPLPRIISCSSTVARVSAGSSRADGLQENPDGPQRTQPFPVSVKELRNRFEALGAKKETEKRSLSSEVKSEPGSPSVSPPKESTVKRGMAIFEQTSSENEHRKISEAGSRKPLTGRPKERTPGTDNTPLDFQETIALKDGLDLYKAAVSKSESINSFADPGHTDDLEKLSPEGTKKKRRRRSHRKAKKQPLPATTKDLMVTDVACGTSAKENVTHTEQKEKASDGTQPCNPEESIKLGPGGSGKKRRRRAHRRSKKQPSPVTTEDLVVTAQVHATSTEENMSPADQKAKELNSTQPGHTSDSEKLSPPAQPSPLRKQKKKEKKRKKHFVLWFRMGCG